MNFKFFHDALIHYEKLYGIPETNVMGADIIVHTTIALAIISGAISYLAANTYTVGAVGNVP